VWLTPHPRDLIQPEGERELMVYYGYSETADVHPDPHVVALCGVFASIATHLTSLYAPYAGQVFDKACSNIEGDVFVLSQHHYTVDCIFYFFNLAIFIATSSNDVLNISVL